MSNLFSGHHACVFHLDLNPPPLDLPRCFPTHPCELGIYMKGTTRTNEHEPCSRSKMLSTDELENGSITVPVDVEI